MQKYNNYSNPPNHPHPDAPLSAPKLSCLFKILFANKKRSYYICTSTKSRKRAI